MAMKTNGLKTGDKCRVKIPWGDGSQNGRRVQIMRFQKHGSQVFAKVFWIGKGAKENEEKYGTLFNVEDELTRV